MPKKELNPEPNVLRKQRDADWVGNNAAFVCPACEHVYIVTGAGKRYLDTTMQPHCNERTCPNCGKSVAHIPKGGRKKARKGEANNAWIEWSEEAE